MIAMAKAIHAAVAFHSIGIRNLQSNFDIRIIPVNKVTVNKEDK